MSKVYKLSILKYTHEHIENDVFKREAVYKAYKLNSLESKIINSLSQPIQTLCLILGVLSIKCCFNNFSSDLHGTKDG